MKLTIKEVAQEAGVSIATVSRVLNGKDRVKKTTREKIEAAIGKLNFKPDQAARSMINNQTKMIGLLVPQLSNEFWGLLAEVIQEQLWNKGYSVLICATGTNPDKESMFLQSFIERRVDGVIYGASSAFANKNNTESPLQLLKEQGIPVVAMDQVTGYHCVVGDGIAGSLLAVEHLLQLGHTRIAYIGGWSVSTVRELGYRGALLEHNMVADEALIIRSTEDVVNFSQYGYQAMKQLVDSGTAFTAAFCANDLVAIGAMRALKESGLKVPEQIAVVGYDDINIAALYDPALTTIHQPIEEMGTAAVKLLLELLQEGSELSMPRKIMLQSKLIIRESSVVQPSIIE
jgi:LacI family transcriptional regulator